jgi:amino acid permease
MIYRASFRRFAFAFGTAFAVFYVLALAKNFALFTVYPSFGVIVWGTHLARDVVDPALGFVAPAMYWYGWAATAALGAFAVGLVAVVMPERWARRIWLGWLWVVPISAMLGCVYLTLPWFRMNI